MIENKIDTLTNSLDSLSEQIKALLDSGWSPAPTAPDLKVSKYRPEPIKFSEIHALKVKLIGQGKMSAVTDMLTKEFNVDVIGEVHANNYSVLRTHLIALIN